MRSLLTTACMLGLLFPCESSGAEPVPELSTSSWEPGDPMRMWDDRLLWDVSIRERLEYFNNWVDFRDGFDQRDDLALVQRLRLGLAIEPVESLKLYAQMQDARTFFDEPEGPLYNREFLAQDDPHELYQAFAEWKATPGSPLGIRVGRQELAIGDGRVLGRDDWGNNGRVLDAVRVHFVQQSWTLEAFAGWPVIARSDEINPPDTQDLLGGVQFEADFAESVRIAPYVLVRSKSDIDTNTSLTNADNQSAGSAAPEGDLVTMGGRVESLPGRFGPVDFRIEAALQVGELRDPVGLGPVVAGNAVNTDDQDHLAGAVHVQVGYTFESVAVMPRLFAEFNYASGDQDPADGTSHAFVPYLADAHGLHGEMDRFSWANMYEAVLGVEMRPDPRWDLVASIHAFWIAETGSPQRSGSQAILGGAARYGNALNNDPGTFAGTELDLKTRYRVTRWLSLESGYSHFFADDYFQDTAPLLNGSKSTDDIDFAYMQLSLVF